MRRDDLYNDNTSESDRTHDEAEDAGIRAKLNERLSRMISLDLKPLQNDDDPAEKMEEDEPELEFRLFSTSAPTVVRPEEDDVQGDGGILAGRPVEFYLRDFTAEERARFREVAVNYEDVLRMARQRAWGLEVPWRVKTITLKQSQPVKTPSSGTRKFKSKLALEEAEEEGSKKRKRPGKKRRILLRTKEKEKAEKERIRKERQEAIEKSKLSKEEHLREKRKRLNREKKLKRRQKEKEKKMAAGGGAGSVGDGGGGDSDSDGSE